MLNIIQIQKIFIFIFFCVLLNGKMCFGQTITIHGNKIINRPTAYRDVNLDLSQGSFTITNNATLRLIHTHVYGTLTPENPFLFTVESGKIDFKNSQFIIRGDTLPPIKEVPPASALIRILDGKVRIKKNEFTIDSPDSAILLVTGHNPTDGFEITQNTVRNFNGGFFLINSNNAYIANNNFYNVSLSNIFTQDSSNNLYEKNQMLYSGNNGFDIIDSKNITVRKNFISLSSCYSILILRSNDLLFDSNQVIGGITYAMYITPDILANPFAKQLLSLVPTNNPSSSNVSKNIKVINNYFSQNRYGIAAVLVDGLIIKNNYFIQRFNDDALRAFWTNNAILFQKVMNVDWENNIYKEAYSQELTGDNAKSDTFVNYPATGGVAIPG